MSIVPCRACGTPLAEQVLDLGEQPACDAFPLEASTAPEQRWPLSLWLCGRCGLVQLGSDVTVREEPLAVESATMLRHAAQSAAAVRVRTGLGAGATVAEAASAHGGSWLPALTGAGLVEVPRWAAGQADLVVDVHGIAHSADTAGELARHAASLRADGTLVLEFHHLLPLLEQGQFDTVRHGHEVYLSLTALVPALAAAGLQVTDAVPQEVYGGSLQLTCRHAEHAGAPDPSVAAVLAAEQRAGVADATALRSLDERATRTSAALRSYLERARVQGRSVAGYGAPSKAPVLLGRAGIGPDLLAFTADLASGKQGRRVPGTGIPIRSPEQLLAARPDEVLVLAWDIVEEVARQLAEVTSWGGRFVVPVPQPHEYVPTT